MSRSSAKERQGVSWRIRQVVVEVLRVNQVPMVVYGVVTATPGGGVVTVKQQGASTVTVGLRYLSSYSPTVNDVVICLNVSGDLWVLGKHA